MAKIALSKINTVKSIAPIDIQIGDQTIQVLQYLPMEQKAALLNDFIGDVLAENGTTAPIREELYGMIYIIKYYTNINITETMINNAVKTYDILQINGINDKVKEIIPQEEWNQIFTLMHQTITVLVNYRTSAAGLLEYLQTSQIADTKEVDEMLDDLRKLETNSLISDVVEKLG